MKIATSLKFMSQARSFRPRLQSRPMLLECLMGLFFILLGRANGSAAEWQIGEGFRSIALSVPAQGKTGFTQVSPSLTGILFTNLLTEVRSITNQIYHNGSGVAAGDIDGDGLCDLYFARIEGGNVLYRNLGHWKFEDVTASAGVACPEWHSTGVVFADVDGDGDLDLLVNAVSGGTHCFLNDGRGHFRDVTRAAGLATTAAGMSVALADIDGDGDLDLYVTHYRNSTLRDEPNTRFRMRPEGNKTVVTAVDGKPVTDPELAGRFTVDQVSGIVEHGQPDALYRNDGQGKFTLVSWTDGSFLDEDGKAISVPYDWGLSAILRDLNGDGAPDIYVCNDFISPDRIWLNQGEGRFRAIPRLAIRQTSYFSMGVDVADINRDGQDDIFVLDMLSQDHRRRHTQLGNRQPLEYAPGAIANRPQYLKNSLLLNRGDGTYAEIAQLAGLQASEWSWTPKFIDVDLDGYEDLLISNGHLHDAQNLDVIRRIEAQKSRQPLSRFEKLRLRTMLPKLDTANCAFRNRGDLTFEDMSVPWGFALPAISQGMAVADLDNDGDLDVVLNNLDSAAVLLRNEANAPRVTVKLKGRPGNTRGIGAKIRFLGGPVPQTQEMTCGGKYLSGDESVQVFAPGQATGGMSLEITWRNRGRSVITNVQANRLYEIEEKGAQDKREARPAPPRPAPPLFKDVSALLAHTHLDEPFQDFARQPLLSRRMSHLGPGLSWFDVDDDGWDDLIIGSGRGGTLSVCKNTGHGGFVLSTQAPLNSPITRDQTTVLGWKGPSGETVLLAGSANYEDGMTNGPVVRGFNLTAMIIEESLPGQLSSTGPLALADFDADGDLDLFVGGRVVPGRFPEPASSLLFRNVEGHFRLDAEASRVLQGVGLVSGAVWSDLDGDGWPELLLACEWGPVRVLHNDQGKLRDTTALLGLDKYRGWWTSVTTGDFDGDGRMDIVAGNWGRNTKYQKHASQLLRVYYGDLNHDGTVELVEAYQEGATKIVPWRYLDTMAEALPILQERCKSFQAYSEADVAEILGSQFQDMTELRVNTLDTMVFLNRGDHFEAAPLPAEAQFAPVFGINVGDLDGDGKEDLFLAQNFFGVDADTGRYDGGRGLWCRGDGQGHFRAVPGQESGLQVYGEGRGSALCDFDADGRVDLAVAQNAAATRLFHNENAQPGLRIRLAAGAGNPTGVGAILRLGDKGHFGPAREIHAGSGYWSQDSAVQIIAQQSSMKTIQVRWSGGATSQAEIPAGAREILLDQASGLQVKR